MSEKTVIEHRVATLETAVGKIEVAVSSIAQSMQAIVRLEEHHAQTRDSVERCFAQGEDHEERLRVLEKDAPTARLVAKWVISWVIGIVSLVGAALIGLVVTGGLPGASL